MVSASKRNNSSAASKRVLFLCAQGGMQDVEFISAVSGAVSIADGGRIPVSVASLRQCDADGVRELAPSVDVLPSFEDFRRSKSVRDVEAEVVRISREYTDANWWAIAASERSFIDASFLVGGLGQRDETREYVEGLLVNMVCYYESILSSGRYAAVLCPEADSLITHVLYYVARKLGVPILAMSPNAWIREDGQPGFFLCRDEFLHSEQIESYYQEISSRALTRKETERVKRFKESVINFNVIKEFRAIRNASFVVPAFSPNLKTWPAYLRKNASRDKDVEYYKINIAAKAKANIIRTWRRWRSKALLGTRSMDFPKRSVFYGLQFQPEQTTLVGGNFFANQVATIESIAKALPFGYTLVVKEHPKGRGSRPAWQYRHLAHYPNIQFCDADAKEILKRCEATVTISGTIGLEALALDKPVVVLGKVYYDFADIVYTANSWDELSRVLRRILIDRDYENNAARHDQINRFFLSYLIARVPGLLNKDAADEISEAILVELDKQDNKEAPSSRGAERKKVTSV